MVDGNHLLAAKIIIIPYGIVRTSDDLKQPGHTRNAGVEPCGIDQTLLLSASRGERLI